MAALGLSVVIHDDRFAQDAEDTVWLSAAGNNGWIAVTKDDRIRYNPLERRALRRAGVHAFVMGHGNLSAKTMITAFEKALPRILKLIAASRLPVIAVVRRDGFVSVIADRKRRDKKGRR